MIYRGYEITKADGGFTWKDERNFVHYAVGVTKTPFATDEAAMNDIDKYRRELRAQS